MSNRISELRRLPFIGTIMAIANAYAYKGDVRHISSFAPFSFWWQRILKRLLVIAALSLILTYLDYAFSDGGDLLSNPGELSVSIFPNLLGFGIGIFALVFGFLDKFKQLLEKADGSDDFGIEILPPDLAYPLIVIAAVLLLSVVLRVFPICSFNVFLQMFLLLYGFAVTFELISFIFFAATHWVHTSNKPDKPAGD